MEEMKIESTVEDKEIKPIPEKEFTPITPQEFMKNPQILDKVKLPQLRANLKYYKQMFSFEITAAYTNILENYGTMDIRRMRQSIKALYNFQLTGTKMIVQERLRHFFQMWRAVLRIQKRFRGYMVRYSQFLRGPAIRNRSLCVNETDFYTLEPLIEIPILDFFSYKTQGFVYGFDINSIRAQLKSNNKSFTNPYTRESMKHILPNIRRLGRLSKLLHVVIHGKTENPAPIQNTSVRIPSLSALIQQTVPPMRNVHIQSNVALFLPADYNQEEMVVKLREIRTKPFLERVHRLFMDIDHLGHYTQANWFLEMNDRDYVRMYRSLQENWNFRSGLGFRVKVSICPLWDPFIMQTVDFFDPENTESIEKRMCLNVMEEMVYTGINDEYRMLGAFHCLAALTIVSIPARNSMMWLYESLR
jgi:hypothetical protein